MKNIINNRNKILLIITIISIILFLLSIPELINSSNSLSIFFERDLIQANQNINTLNALSSNITIVGIYFT